jgi:hypothetical protein
MPCYANVTERLVLEILKISPVSIALDVVNGA